MPLKTLILRGAIGSLLLLFSGCICFLNGQVGWRIHVRKQHAPSWIPLIGGFLGMLALGTIPVEALNKLLWLPLILDYGCLPGIAFTVYAFVAAIIRKRD